jgi:hypothetical protein
MIISDMIKWISNPETSDWNVSLHHIKGTQGADRQIMLNQIVCLNSVL